MYTSQCLGLKVFILNGNVKRSVNCGRLHVQLDSLASVSLRCKTSVDWTWYFWLPAFIKNKIKEIKLIKDEKGGGINRVASRN